MTAVLRDQVSHLLHGEIECPDIGVFVFQGIDAEYVSLEDIIPVNDDGDANPKGL
jgi:hypothetical protein